MIGKSGRYHMNPHHMRAMGDAPEERTEHDGAGDGKGDGKGDGQHHHHLIAHGDGSYTSEHTHPDGKKEVAEHPHFEHAVSHMADKFEEEHEPAAEDEDEEGNEREEDGSAEHSGDADLASMYDQD